MASQARSRITLTFGAILAALLTAVLIAGPTMAQRQAEQSDRPDRPDWAEHISRQCIAETRNLCPGLGRGDREARRACIAQNFSELSQDCASQLRDRVGGQRSDQTGRAPIRRVPVARTVIYGADQRQQVDVYEPADAVEELPLVLFVHGGAWSMGDNKAIGAKPAHFTGSNYYFASAGYRLLPHFPVEEQAADLGAAIQAVRGQAFSIGFDADKIVLIGHSAGAHLAALVASDPSYAGEAFDSIRGVVLLDGAGYDIAANMAQAGPQGFQLYNNVFGTDPARHAALSPIAHVGGRDAPHWLTLYVADRAASRDQSLALIEALSSNQVHAEAAAISGTDHGGMNRDLGTNEGAAQTQAVDAFLQEVFTAQ